jgi:hypothetical protein
MYDIQKVCHSGGKFEGGNSIVSCEALEFAPSCMFVEVVFYVCTFIVDPGYVSYYWIEVYIHG